MPTKQRNQFKEAFSLMIYTIAGPFILIYFRRALLAVRSFSRRGDDVKCRSVGAIDTQQKVYNLNSGMPISMPLLADEAIKAEIIRY